LAELQADLDEYLKTYNEVRTHQGQWCYGRTPMQTFLDTLPLAKEKLQAAWVHRSSTAPSKGDAVRSDLDFHNSGTPGPADS